MKIKSEEKIAVIKISICVLASYVFNKEHWLLRHIAGSTFVSRLSVLFSNQKLVFSNIMPSFDIRDLTYGMIAGIILFLLFSMKKNTGKKFRTGKEYGSARWGSPEDILPFIDEKAENNIILTKTESLSMESRPKDPRYARNKNVLVIGGSGSGKTRFYVKPNIMQMPEKVSYVTTDPKGELISSCGSMLRDNGYVIKTINTIDFSKSMKYNPFDYIHSEKDILKLVNTIMANTVGEGERATEDFWNKAERLLYTAYIGYIWYEGPADERNFGTLLEMINASEVRENDETFKNAVDILFDELEEDDPDHFAVRQYKKLKLSAGKTMKSILISCGARLAPFDIQELLDLTEYDELKLDMIGQEKTALFIVISDTDTTFNFLIAILYSQLFNILCETADFKFNGRLPYHVRILADEFANIGRIPNFDKLIATIRSREISASIILQSQSQLKTMYRDSADTIIGNCDTMLFLGGKEESTLKGISEILGKETIDLYNTSHSKGNSESYSTSYQKTGKELMTRDELAVMDGNKCILQIRGVRPFYSDKYDIKSHKNYHMLSDHDPKNIFDAGEYLSHNFKLKTKEIFELYDCS